MSKRYNFYSTKNTICMAYFNENGRNSKRTKILCNDIRTAENKGCQLNKILVHFCTITKKTSLKIFSFIKAHKYAIHRTRQSEK